MIESIEGALSSAGEVVRHYIVGQQSKQCWGLLLQCEQQEELEASVLRGVPNRELTSDAGSYDSTFLGNVLAQEIVR